MKSIIALTCLALLCITGCDDAPRKTKKASIHVQRNRNTCQPGQPCPCPAEKSSIPFRAPYGQPFAPSTLVTFAELPIPITDLPVNLRQHNYKGGSCYHASIENVMIGQGLYAESQEYRRLYSGGAYTGTISNNLTKQGIKFAYTNNGDFEFLVKALNSRRMIALPYKPGHAINLCGLTNEWAIMLDNNTPHKYDYVPLETFKRAWVHSYGGSAITVVSTPLPPIPHVGLLPEVQALLALMENANETPLELSSL